MSKTIFTALGPNYQSDDVRCASRMVLQPWWWQYGNAPQELEQQFLQMFSAEAVCSFSTGRGALWALLGAIRVQPGDEVLLQAYTCVAVAEPILWHDAKPVYVDVDRATANMSVADLERKITPRSKVLIIQHTFGLPADLDQLLEIAKKYNLIVIEDCAHALGARYQNRFVGTFGHAAFFSFGRDKVISSVFGGIAIAHDQDIAQRLLAVQATFQLPSALWTLQQLVHPIVISAVKKSYDWYGVGKILFRGAQKCAIISKAVYPEERRGGRPNFVTKKMPNALAVLALRQLKKLDSYNHHRQMVAREYHNQLELADGGQGRAVPQVYAEKENIFLRYLLIVDEPLAVLARAKEHKIILGDWYTTPVAPADVDMHAIGYHQRSCPNAEWLAARSINLPTHIGIDRHAIQRIVSLLVEKV